MSETALGLLLLPQLSSCPPWVNLLNSVIRTTLTFFAGGTISRTVHRTIGTVFGACIGFLLGWAVLAAGGPEDISRWVAMEFLFGGIMFIMTIIQQVIFA